VTDVDFRLVDGGDVDVLVPKLREIDLVEAAAFGLTGREALQNAANVQPLEEAFTITIDGEPEGMFGWSMATSSSASIWLLGSDKIFEQPILLCRMSRNVLIEAHKSSELLYNFVAENNVKTIAWLNWLGFEFPGNEILGNNGVTLKYFVRKRKSPALSDI